MSNAMTDALTTILFVKKVICTMAAILQQLAILVKKSLYSHLVGHLQSLSVLRLQAPFIWQLASFDNNDHQTWKACEVLGPVLST